MKIFQIICFILTIFLFLDTSAQNYLSDSTFSHKINYKYWTVCWNDSMAIRVDSRNSNINAIYMNEFKYDDTDTTSPMPYFYRELNFLLSIVGPYLSYEVTYAGSGGVHPITGTYYQTINIETLSEVSLNEIFDRSEIYRALLENDDITKYLVKSNPSDLNDLLSNLDGDCRVDFMDILNRFSFFDIIGDNVLIEFGLPHGCEILRGTFTLFKISLPIPEDSRESFLTAKDDKTLKKYLKKY